MAGVILGMQCQGEGWVWNFSHQPSTHPDRQASQTKSSSSNSSILYRFVKRQKHEFWRYVSSSLVFWRNIYKFSRLTSSMTGQHSHTFRHRFFWYQHVWGCEQSDPLPDGNLSHVVSWVVTPYRLLWEVFFRCHLVQLIHVANFMKWVLPRFLALVM